MGDLLKHIIAAVVEALFQAVPEMRKHKARRTTADADDVELRAAVMRTRDEFEGVDLYARGGESGPSPSALPSTSGRGAVVIGHGPRNRIARAVVAVLLALAFFALTSCGTIERAVIVPPTVPVRLAEPMHDVLVWVKDKRTGQEVKARADLFAGMVVVTDPRDFPTEERAKHMRLRPEPGD